MSFDAITTRHMLWKFSGVKGHNVIRGVKGIPYMPIEVSVKLGAIIPKTGVLYLSNTYHRGYYSQFVLSENFLFFSLLSPLIFLF